MSCPRLRVMITPTSLMSSTALGNLEHVPGIWESRSWRSKIINAFFLIWQPKRARDMQSTDFVCLLPIQPAAWLEVFAIYCEQLVDIVKHVETTVQACQSGLKSVGTILNQVHIAVRANALPGAVIGVPGCRDIIVPRPEWCSATESAEDRLPATPAPPSAHRRWHGAKWSCSNSTAIEQHLNSEGEGRCRD